MELAGLIVRALPKNLTRVESDLNAIAGIEIHHQEPDGRIIITVERDSHKELSASLNQLQSLESTLNVSLVYQHSDEFEHPKQTTVPESVS